ncbi:hypothetical protein KIPB_015595, partial [Kipferlia bialata]|eukprot:g15595.t1
MRHALTVLLAVLALCLAGDTCNFNPWELIDRADALECLRAQPLSQDIMDATFSAALTISDSNVFTDLLLSPPAPFEDLAVDVK